VARRVRGGSWLGRRRGAALPQRQRLGAVLATRRVRLIAAASLVARLPRGMASLSLVLLVHGATRSYALAGAAAAALAIGDAAISPLQGRLIDRFGQRRVLLPSAALYAGALSGLAGAAHFHAPALLLIALCGAGGAAYPPISASMKVLWPTLVAPGEPLAAAYLLESIIQQTFFFVGPLLVAAFVAASSAAAAVIAVGAFALGGTAAFVGTAGETRLHVPTERRHLAGALADSAVRAILAVTLLQSLVFGALYIAPPAFAALHGRANGAGLLFAVMNAGAVAGGLAGVGRRRRGAVAGYVRLCLLMAFSLAPLLLVRSVVQIAVVLVLAGLFIAPTAAASYVLIELVSPRHTRTEAFAWMSTAVAVAVAIGSSTSGLITERFGVRAALAFAVASAGAGAVAAVAVKRPLARRIGRSHPVVRGRGGEED
jgi:MFS family permease